ncbi:NUDIX hydrolase [Nakamurella sp.]|uniref:NUDIX hydrolase n=1 Tax=Nakamurella sp. TaxID=1869182 RepID=UPI003B3B4678
MERTSYVSVDVLLLRYDHGTRRLLLGLHDRTVDPFAGWPALPGVLLHRGERIREAIGRALAKVDLRAAGSGQLVTFDEPNRDPRGPTLSVATWAVGTEVGTATWAPPENLPPLAFDHERIVADCWPLLAGMLWRETDFTRLLTGDEFTVADAVALHTALTGTPPDRGNLNRTLAGLPGLARTDRLASAGRGRPGAVWSWSP